MPSGPVMFNILLVGTLLVGSLALIANLRPPTNARLEGTGPDMEIRKNDRVLKSEAEWRSLLTVQQYEVAREGSTEPPFTGKYCDHHETGIYACVCCGHELFSSEAKFDSGSGWPSYWQPAKPEAVTEIKDISFGMVRTEILCARCESHLGHVFADGPPPTGRRYCINSVSLEFIPA